MYLSIKRKGDKHLRTEMPKVGQFQGQDEMMEWTIEDNLSTAAAGHVFLGEKLIHRSQSLLHSFTSLRVSRTVRGGQTALREANSKTVSYFHTTILLHSDISI